MHWLYGLMSDAVLRTPCLSIVKMMGCADKAQAWGIVPDLVDVLKSVCGPNVLHQRILAMSQDVVDTIRSIFLRNAGAKMAFQVCTMYAVLVFAR